MDSFKMWSVKSVAGFLDTSETYTRNVLVKQPSFPEPRFATIYREGRPTKSKPRWISTDVIEWAQEHYVPEADYSLPEKKRAGRPRRQPNP